jgi:hypothetical protein
VSDNSFSIDKIDKVDVFVNNFTRFWRLVECKKGATAMNEIGEDLVSSVIGKTAYCRCGYTAIFTELKIEPRGTVLYFEVTGNKFNPPYVEGKIYIATDTYGKCFGYSFAGNSHGEDMAECYDIVEVEIGIPELDIEVAEKVMGWTMNGEYGKPPDPAWNPVHIVLAPCYSTDISAAFQVMEKMREKGFGVWINNHRLNNWEVCFTKLELRSKYVCAKTLPETICLAAIAALKSKKE